MSDLDQASPRCDRMFKCRGDFFNVLWWNRNSYQVEFNAFTLFTLADGRQNFIAGLQIHPEQKRLERFRGVASDGNLFTITTEQFSKPRANRFRLRLEDLPHRVRGRKRFARGLLN